MQVGRYRFVDRLAVGGMAEVFVAVATGAQGFEKPVVVKRMLPQLAGNPTVHRMFLDEARTMLNLQHGNIVQILDMGLMDGAPFLALEYIDGKDLKTVLERLWQTGGAMPHGLAAYIAGEVCRALDYAHRKTDARGLPLHIVHRDVNPANIFLSHEGGVKVGDFGLAKARDNLQRSDAGTVKGKVSYLSPEQANGREVDHRSDIFSLGTTLYEMCCSRRAFDAPSDVEVVLKIRECRSSPPSAVAPHIDPDLESIITRAMRADPADRFETADNMREALSRYLGKLPSVPEDRELDDFLEKLFGNDRRSNAAVIKMAPLANGLPLVSSATPTSDVVAPPVSARGHVGGSRRPGRARPLLVVVVIAAAGQLGINTTSFLTIVGAAGLAIGLALKDSLSNLASGVMLILFRPFGVGDVVTAGGVTGKVESITMFNTVLSTPYNQRVIVPNGSVTSNIITNVTANPTRRVDLVVGIGYGDNIAKAKEILAQLVSSDERILGDPAPTIAVSELADSSVNLVVRPWVKTEEYWDVYFSLTENIKTTFDKEGITIPYPQRDLHLFSEQAVEAQP